MSEEKSRKDQSANMQIDEASIDLPEDGIGGRIKNARMAAGLSIEGLSKVTKFHDEEKRGISRPVLSGYEKGTYKPGTRELRVLYQTLGVSPNWLILGDSDPAKTGSMRARYRSDEEFFENLQEAMKRLEPEALNGLANVIFNASVGAANLRDEFTNPMLKLMSEVVPMLDDAIEAKKEAEQILLEIEKLKGEGNIKKN